MNLKNEKAQNVSLDQYDQMYVLESMFEDVVTNGSKDYDILCVSRTNYVLVQYVFQKQFETVCMLALISKAGNVYLPDGTKAYKFDELIFSFD